MSEDEDHPQNLQQLFDCIDQAAEENGRVSWSAIMDEVGRRSFGPLLLLAGLTVLAPIIGDLPGVPTLIGMVVLLIAVQLLLGRHNFWLPGFMLNRSVPKDKLHKALTWLKKPARFIDKLLSPRLAVLTRGPMVRVIAVVCLGIALAMPVMEIVPFSANLAGIALTAFGLALIARDGLLALIALVFTGLMMGVVVYNLV
ncbi:exopolysaccharide biosynthesis protein [Halopseudomonas laoshanensis]|uniref:Exopolysaccharide biosynthesis protein n=1 Tax=Halopseudomonas laoshanensis TaxID=2268758 RepID=A0A7V7GRU9_9GAMM|nr:exopolysaccharide biosynthesis protein [Halopseudomonas laoshanensis]KAA0693203.1 exopolysaccharide biosynthesis protein [Halopseudomonas laoshanensis]